MSKRVQVPSAIASAAYTTTSSSSAVTPTVKKRCDGSGYGKRAAMTQLTPILDELFETASSEVWFALFQGYKLYSLNPAANATLDVERKKRAATFHTDSTRTFTSMLQACVTINDWLAKEEKDHPDWDWTSIHKASKGSYQLSTPFKEAFGEIQTAAADGSAPLAWRSKGMVACRTISDALASFTAQIDFCYNTLTYVGTVQHKVNLALNNSHDAIRAVFATASTNQPNQKPGSLNEAVANLRFCHMPDPTWLAMCWDTKKNGTALTDICALCMDVQSMVGAATPIAKFSAGGPGKEPDAGFKATKDAVGIINHSFTAWRAALGGNAGGGAIKVMSLTEAEVQQLKARKSKYALTKSATK